MNDHDSFRRMTELLALEYNCAPEDLTRTENTLTVSALRAGRRIYAPEDTFFHMATTGGGAVITADERLHPFLREFIGDRTGHWLFEIPNLLPLERELERWGYTLTNSHHMFLPERTISADGRFPVRWLDREDFAPYYGDPRFPNALCERFLPERPDRLAVVALDGEDIVGMAGASEDAPGWLQIGIDVLSQYRSRGVGSFLVTLLKNRIAEQGDIPFYGTTLSNYHSWNIALNAGFRPAWVEIGARRKE